MIEDNYRMSYFKKFDEFRIHIARDIFRLYGYGPNNYGGYCVYDDIPF